MFNINTPIFPSDKVGGFDDFAPEDYDAPYITDKLEYFWYIPMKLVTYELMVNKYWIRTEEQLKIENPSKGSWGYRRTTFKCTYDQLAQTHDKLIYDKSLNQVRNMTQQELSDRYQKKHTDNMIRNIIGDEMDRVADSFKMIFLLTDMIVDIAETVSLSDENRKILDTYKGLRNSNDLIIDLKPKSETIDKITSRDILLQDVLKSYYSDDPILYDKYIQARINDERKIQHLPIEK